jgi:hypothetical protein
LFFIRFVGLLETLVNISPESPYDWQEQQAAGY